MQELMVDLGERSYPIYIGSSLIGDSKLITRHVHGNQVLIVTNETVAPLYLEQVAASCQGLSVSRLILPDGETYKNLATVNLVFDKLLKEKHNRSTTLIALGGGVIGDITGFAAACYQRGVKFIQIPTTLLSQVDSSVGGKTGVNHPMGKNMIGAFYQPQCVIADTSVLNTLPKRQLRAGFAEVIKYGLICDKPFFEWLENHFQAALNLDADKLEYIISRSCQNKADVVTQDEKESGIRAILNLGHTFGHAIETFQQYKDWLHGEAIAAGMVMAADLSVRLGWLPIADAQRISNLIKASGLPVYPPADINPDQFIELMLVDKKVINGNLRLVLLKTLGEAVITNEFELQILSQTLMAGEKLCSRDSSVQG